MKPINLESDVIRIRDKGGLLDIAYRQGDRLGLLCVAIAAINGLLGEKEEESKAALQSFIDLDEEHRAKLISIVYAAYRYANTEEESAAILAAIARSKEA